MSGTTKHSEFENTLFSGLGFSIMAIAFSILYMCNVGNIKNILPGLKPYSWRILGLSILAAVLILTLLNIKNIGKGILNLLKLLFKGFKSTVKTPVESSSAMQNLSFRKKVKATGEPLGEDLPPVSLLGDVVESKAYIDKDLPKKVEKVFETLDLNIKVKNYIVGASITKFTLDMDKSVRIKNLMSVKDDIGLHLHVDSVNLVSTSEGMALEVPNKERRMVYHRMVMESLRYEKFKELSVILGEKSTGEPFYFDLEDGPHLLVAGATGMGKSVCINTIICSFLMRCSPKDLKLLLIDPKQVEFSMYGSLPHLARPVVKGINGGIDALKWCVEEMERRYKILDDMGIKKLHILPINKRPFPLMIIIVDELADLILSAGKEIDNLISRLAGKARAAGMHLILATQRPSADIISGLIRSNILGRIALKTDKAVESGIILDRNGAETLTGRGEMLVKLPGYSDLMRCQGSFIDDKNMEAIVKWWIENNTCNVTANEPITKPNKVVFDLSEPGENTDIPENADTKEAGNKYNAELLLRSSICSGVTANDDNIEITLPPYRNLMEDLEAQEWEVRQALDKLKQENWIQTVGNTRSSKTIVILSREDAEKWLSENEIDT